MARDFDNFPIYDPIIKNGTYSLSNVWIDFFSTFMQSLQGYLSQNGIFLPQLTQNEINALPIPTVGKPLGNFINTSGQMVFDTTNNVPRVFVIALDVNGLVTSASWKTFTIT